MMAGSTLFLFFSSRRLHTGCYRDWSSDVCSSDLESDNSARLGDYCVAKHRVTGTHPTGCRVRQNRHVRNAAFGKLRKNCRGLRHLHQTQDALLHARAAGCRNKNEREFSLERLLSEPRDLFTDNRAHRATHEREVHHAKTNGQSHELSRERQDGVAITRLYGGPFKALRILRKAQRVGRTDLGLCLLGRAFVEKNIEVLNRTNSAMVLTRRTHVEVPDEFLAEVRVAALVALLPRVRRNLEPLVTGRTGFLFLTEPGHLPKCDRGGKAGQAEANVSEGRKLKTATLG